MKKLIKLLLAPIVALFTINPLVSAPGDINLTPILPPGMSSLKKGDKVIVIATREEGEVHLIDKDDIIVKFSIPADPGRVRFETKFYKLNEVELIK